VPYGAYRSLATEREDRTYELLSVTTLRPRQIIGGKLAGAVLQMLVYLSAISPCLAFTYLLRGLDILTIATIIVYLFFGSL
jgi:ABC-type Na+ efflux pump permease subunit